MSPQANIQAATAPVILNTGASGYGSQNNSAASTSHAADDYINVSCGNRGKQDTATGTNISSWVNSTYPSTVSFTLADAAAYRTNGANKAMPSFDVIDYGQEDYVFGSSERDARHWNKYLLDIFETYADTLAPLFNQ